MLEFTITTVMKNLCPCVSDKDHFDDGDSSEEGNRHMVLMDPLNLSLPASQSRQTLSPDDCAKRGSGIRTSKTFDQLSTRTDEAVTAPRKLSDQPYRIPTCNDGLLIWDGEGNILFGEENTRFKRSRAYMTRTSNSSTEIHKDRNRNDVAIEDVSASIRDKTKNTTAPSNIIDNLNNNHSIHDNDDSKTPINICKPDKTDKKGDGKKDRQKRLRVLLRRKSASFSDFGIDADKQLTTECDKKPKTHRRIRSETENSFFDISSPKMLRLRKQHTVNSERFLAEEKIPRVNVTSQSSDSDSDEIEVRVNDGKCTSPKNESNDQDILHGETAYDAEIRKRALTVRARRRSSLVQIPTASIQMDLHTLYLESINATKTKKGKLSDEPKRKLQKNFTLYGSFEEENDKKPGRIATILKQFKKEDASTRTLEDFKEFKEHLRSNLTEVSDHELAKYKDAHWSTLGKFDDDCSEITTALHKVKLSDQERKRFEALWELLYAEISYLINNLIIIHDVFAKPLEHAKSFGFLANVSEEILFANLQSMINTTSDFAKRLLKIFTDCSTSISRSTEIIVDAFKLFNQTLTQEYKQYSLNYQKAKLHLESSKEDEIFQEFIKHCEKDSRCNRRQLEDFLVAPLQHLTKYPLLLKAIRKHSPQGDRNSYLLTTTIKNTEHCIQTIEKKISAMMNLQRLREIQESVTWPVLGDVEKKNEIPDFVRNDLANSQDVVVLVNPNRTLLQEGILTLADGNKTEFYLFLFDDMLLLTKPRKKWKQQRRNTGADEKLIAEQTPTRTKKLTSSDSLNMQYVVHKQPLPVDRLKIYDCDEQPSATAFKNSICLVSFNRYRQAVYAYTFQAASPEEKTIWLKNLRKAKEDTTSEGFSAKDISSDEEYML